MTNRSEPEYVHFPCDAVLFDLDGVLVDSSAVVERHWERWALAHGRSAREILSIAHGRRIEETLQLVAPELDVQREAHALAAAEAADVEGLRVVPGAQEMLTGLPPGSWAIVTSGTRAVAMARIRHARLPLPAVLVTADDVEAGKPAPEPYLKAAADLGVRPEQCVVVEDAPAGIASAAAAGMRVIAIAGTFERGKLTDAAIIADRLVDLDLKASPRGTPRLLVGTNTNHRSAGR